MTDFGRDTSCTDTLRIGRMVSGVRVVAEAAYRRLISRKGELLSDPDYGLCLADYLGASSSPSDVARLPGLVRSQLLRDARLRSVDASVDETSTGTERAWEVTVEGYTDAGPFALVVAVSGVTTKLLGMTA